MIRFYLSLKLLLCLFFISCGKPNSLHHDVQQSIGKNESLRSEGLFFDPSKLVFNESPISIPKVSEFRIINSLKTDVEIFSVESPNIQFHPILFQPISLEPSENLVVQILFLPYTFDTVQCSIQIITSEGDFSYYLEGRAVSNPYNLKPIIDRKIPYGSVTYERPIVMFNPHMDTLQVKEVFTTEDFLALKGAPMKNDGKTSDSNDILWQLQPGAEKTIITLSISTSISLGLHTGYVHIKTDHDNIVVPIEFEIVEGGPFITENSLDFGTLTSIGEQSSLDLIFANNGRDYYRLLRILPKTSMNSVSIVYNGNGTISPGVGVKSNVASVTFTANSPGKFEGFLLAYVSKNDHNESILEISYSAAVLSGGLGYTSRNTVFVIPRTLSGFKSNNFSTLASDLSTQKVNVTNHFPNTVQIMGVKLLSCLDFMFFNNINFEKIRSLQSSSVVELGLNISKLRRIMQTNSNFLPKTCWLEIWTNITSQRLPFHITEGTIKLEYIETVSYFSIVLHSCR